MELFFENGSEGFVSLLVEIAPYLKAPLIILAGDMFVDFIAQTWLVQPGCKDVQTMSVLLP
jgi:hypothetical protein